MELDLFAHAPRPLAPADANAQLGGAAHGLPLEPPCYTVSEVNELVSRLLEDRLPPVWVSGEISGWRRYPKGHCYFCLKDQEAQLRAVMFRSDAQRLPTQPTEGLQVRALGTLSLYQPRGEFQLVVRELEAVAAGGLWRLAFERLHARLREEGLLDPARKRPLPRFPATIGVVTSPVGAALQDILKVLSRRAPWTRVLLSPARVQGEGAAQDIAVALRAFNEVPDVDVIIVGRGGGSIEDLWAFNDELVARAIAECGVPVVSAVGHETDLTIADLVADFRAATPSAAAECVVPDAASIGRDVLSLRRRLERSIEQHVSARAGHVDLLSNSLRSTVERACERRQERIARAAERLDALSPLSILGRGYAVPLDPSGRVLRRAAEFPSGKRFSLRLSEGSVGCRVEEGGTPPVGSDD